MSGALEWQVLKTPNKSFDFVVGGEMVRGFARLSLLVLVCCLFSIFLLSLPLCKQSLAANLHLTPIGVKHDIYFRNLYP
jgi:hypothetical protein